MQKNIFSKLKRLFPVVVISSLTLVFNNCAPQSIKTDLQGVELLPNPHIGLESQASPNILEGKSFIGDAVYVSYGEVQTVIQFGKEGI